MIENLIYWTGVSVLLTGGLALSLTFIYAINHFVQARIIQELKCTYNHGQLRYVMKEIKAHGKSATIEKAKKEGWSLLDKDAKNER